MSQVQPPPSAFPSTPVVGIPPMTPSAEPLPLETRLDQLRRILCSEGRIRADQREDLGPGQLGWWATCIRRNKKVHCILVGVEELDRLAGREDAWADLAVAGWLYELNEYEPAPEVPLNRPSFYVRSYVVGGKSGGKSHRIVRVRPREISLALPGRWKMVKRVGSWSHKVRELLQKEPSLNFTQALEKLGADGAGTWLPPQTYCRVREELRASLWGLPPMKTVHPKDHLRLPANWMPGKPVIVGEAHGAIVGAAPVAAAAAIVGEAPGEREVRPEPPLITFPPHGRPLDPLVEKAGKASRPPSMRDRVLEVLLRALRSSRCLQDDPEAPLEDGQIGWRGEEEGTPVIYLPSSTVGKALLGGKPDVTYYLRRVLRAEKLLFRTGNSIHLVLGGERRSVLVVDASRLEEPKPPAEGHVSPPAPSPDAAVEPGPTGKEQRRAAWEAVAALCPPGNGPVPAETILGLIRTAGPATACMLTLPIGGNCTRRPPGFRGSEDEDNPRAWAAYLLGGVLSGNKGPLAHWDPRRHGFDVVVTRDARHARNLYTLLRRGDVKGAGFVEPVETSPAPVETSPASASSVDEPPAARSVPRPPVDAVEMPPVRGGDLAGLKGYDDVLLFVRAASAICARRGWAEVRFVAATGEVEYTAQDPAAPEWIRRVSEVS